MLSTLQEADGPMNNSLFCLQTHIQSVSPVGCTELPKGKLDSVPLIQQLRCSAKSPLQDERDLEMLTEARRIQLDF